MLLHSALAAIFALPTLISGGQFPVVNGTIGGVPHDASEFKDLAEAVSGDAPTPRTPGKLRVVENSGVCGGAILFCYASSVIFSFSGRNDAGCLPGLRVW